MDRRLRARRWTSDRRAPAADELRAALLVRGPLTFSELVDAAGSADVATVAEWLAAAQLSGLVEELPPGPDGGERRFRLREDEAPPERRQDRVSSKRFSPGTRRTDPHPKRA
jgi:hypothetical protein